MIDFKLNNAKYFADIIEAEHHAQILGDLKKQVTDNFYSDTPSLPGVEDVNVGDTCSSCQFQLVTCLMTVDPVDDSRRFQMVYEFIGTAA